MHQRTAQYLWILLGGVIREKVEAAKSSIELLNLSAKTQEIADIHNTSAET